MNNYSEMKAWSSIYDDVDNGEDDDALMRQEVIFDCDEEEEQQERGEQSQRRRQQQEGIMYDEEDELIRQAEEGVYDDYDEEEEDEQIRRDELSIAGPGGRGQNEFEEEEDDDIIEQVNDEQGGGGYDDLEIEEIIDDDDEQEIVNNNGGGRQFHHHFLEGEEEDDDGQEYNEDEDYDGIYANQVQQAGGYPTTVNLNRPVFKEPRKKMDERHPKFCGMNNMQLIARMVEKGKIVNPADDDEEDFLYINPEQEFVLAKRGIRAVSSNRDLDSRNGNDLFVTRRTQTKILYLGGGVPLEPVLSHPKLNDIVENFRQELAYRRHVYKDKVKLKVDPSSIVPASVSGSAGSSSIGSEETDPEYLATDDESESEIINGSIAAWIVPDHVGSRSPTPEYELEEPEFILTTGSHHHHHSMEPPTKKRKQKHEPQPHTDGRIYPKPGFSYSCLIAMSLKNSKTGCLPVSEIYKFMCDHFPYFKTAPSGWKNSVRHNLSLNKCFEKIEKPGNGARKGCLWALNPQKIHKMDEEVQKWSRKDPLSIRRAMSDPENLELLERGELKKDYSGNGSEDDEEEEYVEAATIIATQAQRPSDQKLHLKKDDPLDFGTITNVQGNYFSTAPSGPQTYTLQFSNLATTTPIIIRRTPVK